MIFAGQNFVPWYFSCASSTAGFLSRNATGCREGWSLSTSISTVWTPSAPLKAHSVAMWW